jgi:hypothetical protein
MMSIILAQVPSGFFASGQIVTNYMIDAHGDVWQVLTTNSSVSYTSLFMAGLASGGALSVIILTYRKVKEGLNASSGD